MFGGLWLNALLVLGVVLYSFVHGLITSASVLGNRLHVGVVVLVNGVLQVGAAIAFGHRMGLNGVALAGLIVGLLTAVPAGMVLLQPVAALTTARPDDRTRLAVARADRAIAAASTIIGALYGSLGLWGSGTMAAVLSAAVSLAHAAAVRRAAARSAMDALAGRAAPAAGAAGRRRRAGGRRAALSVVPIDWQIVTGEYPPQPGGVSDYTRLVARGLAGAGDRVEVWAPPCGRRRSARSGRHRAPAAGPVRPVVAGAPRSVARRAPEAAPAAGAVRAARVRLEGGEPAVLSVAPVAAARRGVGDVSRGRIPARARDSGWRTARSAP